jgi:hypothetical protein
MSQTPAAPAKDERLSLATQASHAPLGLVAVAAVSQTAKTTRGAPALVNFCQSKKSVMGSTTTATAPRMRLFGTAVVSVEHPSLRRFVTEKTTTATARPMKVYCSPAASARARLLRKYVLMVRTTTVTERSTMAARAPAIPHATQDRLKRLV